MLTGLKQSICGLNHHIKILEKEIKNLKHIAKHKNQKKSIRPPSGFVKPADVSNELCNFMEEVMVLKFKKEVTQY